MIKLYLAYMNKAYVLIIILLSIFISMTYVFFGRIRNCLAWKNKANEKESENIELKKRLEKIESDLKKEQEKQKEEQEKQKEEQEKQKEEQEKLKEKLAKLEEELVRQKEAQKKKLKKMELQIYNCKEEVKYTDVKTLLLEELIFNIEKNNEMKIKTLNKDYLFLLNCYRILFYRKISNLILENIFGQSSSFVKTECTFIDRSKPLNLQKPFQIIVVKKTIENIKEVPKEMVNLIIDFLNCVKDRTSGIIHISDNELLFQIDYLHQILNGTTISKNQSDQYILRSNQAIDLLFKTTSNEEENDNKIFSKGKSLIKNLFSEKAEKNPYDNIKEELIKIRDAKINIINSESEDKEEEESASINKINDHDLFSKIKDVLYPNKNENERIVNKINEEINVSQKIIEFSNNFKVLKEKYDKNEQTICNIELFYQEWKDSFGKGYKNSEVYKKLIKFNNTSLTDIKNNISLLIKGETFLVYEEDAHNFTNKIKDTLKKDEIYSY